MNALKIILIIVAILLVGLVAAYGYFGGFNKIILQINKAGGEVLVYENVTGDYAQTPTVSNRVYYSLLDDFKVETTKGFGIFYDNPRNVDKSMLRSEVGCILDAELDSTKTAEISAKFQMKTLPETENVIAEFPYRGSLSIMVGIFKVYPALEKYIEEKGYKANGPVMEIYDVPNKKIMYRQEVIK